jgi:DNA-binding CsgD family transcriptional regulator
MSIIDDIVNTFKETNSVRKTARDNYCSWNRVVKILSTNGVIVNNTHEIILQLYGKGMNAEKIAKQTGYNIKTVKAYLPSTRPYYGVDQSANAKRIAKCRERKRETDAREL